MMMFFKNYLKKILFLSVVLILVGTQSAYISRWAYVHTSGSKTNVKLKAEGGSVFVNDPWYLNGLIKKDGFVLMLPVVENHVLWTNLKYHFVQLWVFSGNPEDGDCDIDDGLKGEAIYLGDDFVGFRKEGKFYYFPNGECLMFVSQDKLSRTVLSSLGNSVGIKRFTGSVQNSVSLL